MSVRSKIPGVYIHTHKETGAFFIGSSVDVYRSATEDMRRLRNGTHSSKALLERYAQNSLIDTRVICCNDVDEAERLKRSLIAEDYSNPLLLNQRGLLNVCAVYRITHKPTGHFYIGSSSNFSDRKRVHLSALRNNRNPCPKLQELFNENPNFDDLHWDVILIHPISEAHALEEKFIKEAEGNPLLMNLSQSAKGTRGIVWSDEEKSRRSTLAKQLWAEGRMRDPSVSGASKKVSIDGNIYDSVVAASKQLNLATHHIYRRVKSDEWPSYQYL